MSERRLQREYYGMLYRCYSPKASSYKYYGGRGVNVCPAWRKDFNTFRAWALTNGYGENLELDRIDNYAGYSPDNCRWVSHKDNSRNRRVRENSLSGVTGVVFRWNRHKTGGKWRVGIMVDGKQIHLGQFEDIGEAIEARKNAEMDYWGFSIIHEGGGANVS